MTTAGEFLKQLNSDPEWVQEHQKRQRKFAEFDAELAANEAPLVDELRMVGVDVESVWDLVGRSDYSPALPILIENLKKDYHPRIREGIARALGEAEAKKFLPQIFEAFERESNNDVNGPKWALGNTIDILADETHYENVARLALDKKHGEARTMLVHALARWENRSSAAKDALDQLSKDETMGKHVEAARSKR